MHLRGHGEGLYAEASFTKVTKVRDVKLFVTEKNIAFVSTTKMFEMISRFFYSCGSEGFSKLMVRIKNNKDATVFDTYNVRRAWSKF